MILAFVIVSSWAKAGATPSSAASPTASATAREACVMRGYSRQLKLAAAFMSPLPS